MSIKKPYANEYTTAGCRVVELPDIIFGMFFACCKKPAQLSILAAFDLSPYVNYPFKAVVSNYTAIKNGGFPPFDDLCE